MVVDITFDSILIFLVFIVVVFVLYKTFKVIVKASLVVFAAFTFPWIAQYLGLPITASVEMGLMFASAGFGLFMLYEFFNFIAQLFRILMWPFKKKKVS